MYCCAGAGGVGSPGAKARDECPVPSRTSTRRASLGVTPAGLSQGGRDLLTAVLHFDFLNFFPEQFSLSAPWTELRIVKMGVRRSMSKMSLITSTIPIRLLINQFSSKRITSGLLVNYPELRNQWLRCGGQHHWFSADSLTIRIGVSPQSEEPASHRTICQPRP